MASLVAGEAAATGLEAVAGENVVASEASSSWLKSWGGLSGFLKSDAFTIIIYVLMIIIGLVLYWVHQHAAAITWIADSGTMAAFNYFQSM